MEKGSVFFCNCDERTADRFGRAHIGVRWAFDMSMYNKGYIELFCPRCGKKHGDARMIDARGKLYDED